MERPPNTHTHVGHRKSDIDEVLKSPEQIAWKSYYVSRANAGPRSTLVEAVTYVENKGNAVDLGAGTLNEVKYLLDSGFENVLAVDLDPQVSEFAKHIPDERLEVQINRMQDAGLEESAFDLISAQSSLYFVPPADLKPLISNIIQALKPGGIFTAQFLGPHDDWHGMPGRYTETLEEVAARLHKLEILKELKNREYDAGTATNPDTLKHWHIIDVLARKKRI